MSTDSLTDAWSLELSVYSDDLRCEADHTPKNPTCSVLVAARFWSLCGSGPVLVCENTLRYVRRVQDHLCRCGNRVSDCWRIVPV